NVQPRLLTARCGIASLDRLRGNRFASDHRGSRDAAVRQSPSIYLSKSCCSVRIQLECGALAAQLASSRASPALQIDHSSHGRGLLDSTSKPAGTPMTVF